MSRRSGAVFLIPLLGAAAYALLSFSGGEWGQWLWAVDLMTGITVLTGPIAAACAAYLCWTQSRLADLVASAPRRHWVPVRCAAQAWAIATVAYAVTAATIVIAFAVRAHGGPFPFWVALIGLAVLGACAVFGALAARVAPYRITVALVGPAVFLLGAFGPAPYADLLRYGPVTGSLTGLRFDPVFWSLQSGGLVLLGGTCAGALVALDRWRGGTPHVVPAVVALVCLGGLMACGTALDTSGRERLILSDERPTVCDGWRPRICVAPSSTHALGGTAAAMRRAVDQLTAIGITVPARYEELLPGYRPPERVGMIDADVDTDGLVSGAGNVATPAACPAWTDSRSSPDVALQARELVVAWIRVRAGQTVSLWSRAADRWAATASSSQTKAWVRRTFHQLALCDLDEVRLPDGVSSGW